MKANLEKGIHLFNSQKYFETHEVLEEVWLRTEGEKKTFLHGLIQIAAAFHHHTKGNPAGFHSLLEKGLRKLENFGDVEEEIDLSGLRQQLQPWRTPATHPAGHSRHPPLPQIQKKR